MNNWVADKIMEFVGLMADIEHKSCLGIQQGREESFKDKMLKEINDICNDWGLSNILDTCKNQECYQGGRFQTICLDRECKIAKYMKFCNNIEKKIIDGIPPGMGDLKLDELERADGLEGPIADIHYSDKDK